MQDEEEGEEEEVLALMLLLVFLLLLMPLFWLHLKHGKNRTNSLSAQVFLSFLSSSIFFFILLSFTVEFSIRFSCALYLIRRKI